MVEFPSVQCGEPDAEDIGDFKIRHTAFTTLTGYDSHPWAIYCFATSAPVAATALVAERRTSFSPLWQWITRLVHEKTLARQLAVYRQSAWRAQTFFTSSVGDEVTHVTHSLNEGYARARVCVWDTLARCVTSVTCVTDHHDLAHRRWLFSLGRRFHPNRSIAAVIRR
jgi:hypothetical protein